MPPQPETRALGGEATGTSAGLDVAPVRPRRAVPGPLSGISGGHKCQVSSLGHWHNLELGSWVA
jgi:hypothetical protein